MCYFVVYVRVSQYEERSNCSIQHCQNLQKWSHQFSKIYLSCPRMPPVIQPPPMSHSLLPSSSVLQYVIGVMHCTPLLAGQGTLPGAELYTKYTLNACLQFTVTPTVQSCCNIQYHSLYSHSVRLPKKFVIKRQYHTSESLLQFRKTNSKLIAHGR